MTQEEKNQALDLLPCCVTLMQADDRLAVILVGRRWRALRWGLFDGYRGRPKALSGVSAGDKPDKGAELDYAEGYEVGRELYLRGVPA
jgi:hypothetical protein